MFSFSTKYISWLVSNMKTSCVTIPVGLKYIGMKFQHLLVLLSRLKPLSSPKCEWNIMLLEAGAILLRDSGRCGRHTDFGTQRSWAVHHATVSAVVSPHSPRTWTTVAASQRLEIAKLREEYSISLGHNSVCYFDVNNWYFKVMTTMLNCWSLPSNLMLFHLCLRKARSKYLLTKWSCLAYSANHWGNNTKIFSTATATNVQLSSSDKSSSTTGPGRFWVRAREVHASSPNFSEETVESGHTTDLSVQPTQQSVKLFNVMDPALQVIILIWLFRDSFLEWDFFLALYSTNFFSLFRKFGVPSSSSRWNCVLLISKDISRKEITKLETWVGKWFHSIFVFWSMKRILLIVYIIYRFERAFCWRCVQSWTCDSNVVCYRISSSKQRYSQRHQGEPCSFICNIFNLNTFTHTMNSDGAGAHAGRGTRWNHHYAVAFKLVVAVFIVCTSYLMISQEKS